MRIISGKLKGRTLAALSNSVIRPTADRVKENLFNILESAYGKYLLGARVLDLFAGTGSLGFEALSRGANYVVLVDNSIDGRAAIRSNILELGVASQCRLLKRDATALGANTLEPFKLLFLDPPYGQGLAEQALEAAREGGWLAPDNLIIIEEAKQSTLQLPVGATLLDKRNYGQTQLNFVTLTI